LSNYTASSSLLERELRFYGGGLGILALSLAFVSFPWWGWICGLIPNPLNPISFYFGPAGSFLAIVVFWGWLQVNSAQKRLLGDKYRLKGEDWLMLVLIATNLCLMVAVTTWMRGL
jgi:hypothetical protein